MEGQGGGKWGGKGGGGGVQEDFFVSLSTTVSMQ